MGELHIVSVYAWSRTRLYRSLQRNHLLEQSGQALDNP